MASVIEREAKRMVLYEIPGITRCLLSESHELGQEGVMKLRFEGVNVQVGVHCNPLSQCVIFFYCSGQRPLSTIQLDRL